MAQNESLIFDSLELNPLPPTSSVFSLDEFNPGNPRKRPEWVQGADADGAALVRDPLTENRTVTATVRVTATTRDLVHDGIAQLVAKCEEAEQQPDGLPLVWTPADSTDSFTLYVLSGEVGDIPVTHESGYFAGSVAVPLTLTCKPFGYGSEIAGTPVTAATPLVTTTVAGVPGDVPAEARIIVTDNATQARRDVIWGLEQHDYNAGSPASLLLTGADFVTSGFGGTASALTGSYGTGNPISATVYAQPSAICGTGNQPHIGTYRVRLRIQTSDVAVRVRLTWQDGDGPLSSNSWVSTPLANQWCEVDAGLITITKATLGSARWTGRIDAYSSDGSGHTVYVNLLELIPAGEGYGRARAAYTYRPGVAAAYDAFINFTTGNLNGRTAPQGGAWTTAGSATDFVGTPSGAAVGLVVRSTTADGAPRFAVLGSSISDTEVQALVGGGVNQGKIGVVARYVDTSNYLSAFVTQVNPPATLPPGTTPNTFTAFSVNIVVAGSTTAYTVPILLPWGTVFRVRLVVYATGAVYASLFEDSAALSTLGAAPGKQYAAISIGAGMVGVAALAAGGALASGTAGIFDTGTSTVAGSSNVRTYTNVTVGAPTAEPIAIYSSQQIEFRSDNILRKDASGTYYGRPSSYRGSRALVPPAGDKNRTSRVAVAVRRADTDTSADGGVTDSTTLQVNVTPRYLVVPH